MQEMPVVSFSTINFPEQIRFKWPQASPTYKNIEELTSFLFIFALMYAVANTIVMLHFERSSKIIHTETRTSSGRLINLSFNLFWCLFRVIHCRISQVATWLNFNNDWSNKLKIIFKANVIKATAYIKKSLCAPEIRKTFVCLGIQTNVDFQNEVFFGSCCGGAFLCCGMWIGPYWIRIIFRFAEFTFWESWSLISAVCFLFFRLFQLPPFSHLMVQTYLLRTNPELMLTKLSRSCVA